MTYCWHYNKVRQGDMIRKPIQGEFYPLGPRIPGARKPLLM